MDARPGFSKAANLATSPYLLGWEVCNDHPFAGYRRNARKKRAILPVNITATQITEAHQCILAGELEDLMG